jgi:hypothetical protein
MKDTLVGLRDLFGVIRMELRVKSSTLINPRSKICSAIQLHVCVYFFVCLLNKKFSCIFLKVFCALVQKKRF